MYSGVYNSMCVFIYCWLYLHVLSCHKSCQGRSQPLEVAVKIFDHFGSANADSAAELVRTYSDMRYELNKVVSLSHAFIVQFVGVFTNPHCFVLEWAPLKTLESIRCNHIEANHSICPTSMYLMLIQVKSQLSHNY